MLGYQLTTMQSSRYEQHNQLVQGYRIQLNDCIGSVGRSHVIKKNKTKQKNIAVSLYPSPLWHLALD